MKCKIISCNDNKFNLDISKHSTSWDHTLLLDCLILCKDQLQNTFVLLKIIYCTPSSFEKSYILNEKDALFHIVQISKIRDFFSGKKNSANKN